MRIQNRDMTHSSRDMSGELLENWSVITHYTGYLFFVRVGSTLVLRCPCNARLTRNINEFRICGLELVLEVLMSARTYTHT